MPASPVTVLIVDDQVLFRQGVAGLIGTQPDFTVVGEAGSVAEAVEKVRQLQPELVLMDFRLPDGTGADATKAILQIRPQTKVVILTVHDETELLLAAIRAGAKGYLLKNTRVEKLLGFLRGLEQGEAAIEPRMTTQILDAFSRSPGSRREDPILAQLSERERQVLDLLATDASNADIAARLYISENTVKNHVSSILGKLGLPNRREAARYVLSRKN